MSATVKLLPLLKFLSMRYLLGICLFLLLISVYSCKTDFDINAEKKDITVVYGLLDQGVDTQYVKITKAFLGDVSAYEMAKDSSLSSYGDDIIVTVSETTNGITGRTFSLQKTWVNDKDQGVFYAPYQEVYYFVPVPALSSLSTYKIEIKNKISGKKSTATTGLVKETFSITNPPPGSPAIGFVNQAGEYGEYTADWKSAKNGRIYYPYFRFYFTEVNKADTNIKVVKYVDWHLGSTKSSMLDGGEKMSMTYQSESFYKTIQSSVAINPDVDRIIGNIDFIISVGGDELSIYMDLNEPSSSIVQERPSFTNITTNDGTPCVGIFSCRYSKKFSSKLSAPSVDKLIHGEYTSQLGFK